MTEMLTAAEAARKAGIAEGTWRGYVSRGHAPLPDERDQRTGRPGWLESTIDDWLAARPGQGSRTDLDCYCGCCGGRGDEPPKGEHGRCCAELHDALPAWRE